MLRLISILILFPFLLFPQKIFIVELNCEPVAIKNLFTSIASEIQGKILSKELMEYTSKKIIDLLQSNSFYHSSFEFNIDSTNSESIKMVINISAGYQAFLSDFEVVGDSSEISTKLKNRLSYLIDKPFNQSEIEKIIIEYLNVYEKNGYPFASIEILSIEFVEENNRYDTKLKINIDLGIKSVISTIEITGNKLTKDYVITREIDIKEGEIYNQQKIDDIPRKLNKLRFFHPVNPARFNLNNKMEGILSIEVKEKETNSFDGIIGYIPSRNKNEKGYLTGLVNISMRNLFGTGRAVAIKWQQLDRLSQEFNLRYLEPWFLSLPFNIGLGLYQRVQDSIYVQRKLDANIEYMASREITFALSVETESVIPSELTIPKFSVFNSTRLTTGLSFIYDSRDDPLAPTLGLYLKNSFLLTDKTINGPEEFITPNLKLKTDMKTYLFDASYYLEIFNKQVLSLSIKGREINGDLVELSDLFRLGGSASLRGYVESQFIGERIAWSNIEYRFFLETRSYAFTFFDYGYYLRKENQLYNIKKTDAYKYGYGLGLALETGLGILSVSFALGEGDGFSEGKIHFGLINEF